jgi:protein TonB
MLAYAPRPEGRRFSPAALALILGAHAVAIAAVMSARIDVVRQHLPPTIVDLIPEPEKPKPPEPRAETPRASTQTKLTAPDPLIDPPPMPGPTADPLPPTPMPPLPPGPSVDPLPIPKPVTIVHTGPRFATPADAIRPPYPEAMRAAEKEALLRLKLSIDERGRVTAVDPVGKAEPAFFAAARRHILKAWRYTPAMEGDRAICSTTVVTLEFKLDS